MPGSGPLSPQMTFAFGASRKAFQAFKGSIRLHRACRCSKHVKRSQTPAGRSVVQATRPHIQDTTPCGITLRRDCKVAQERLISCQRRLPEMPFLDVQALRRELIIKISCLIVYAGKPLFSVAPSPMHQEGSRISSISPTHMCTRSSTCVHVVVRVCVSSGLQASIQLALDGKAVMEPNTSPSHTPPSPK